jgi:OmpA-OmpF porin, OOP family
MTRSLFVCLVVANAVLWLPLSAAADDNNSYAGFDVGPVVYSGESAQTILPLIGAGHASGTETSSFTNSSAFRLFGGYQFNSNWGIEASYVDLGESDFNISESGTGTVNNPGYSGGTRVWGWSVAGTGALPLDDQWALYARLGVIDGHVKLSNVTTDYLGTVINSNSSADWKTLFGAGIKWAFADNWSARLGWDYYPHLGNSHTTGEVNVNQISIGIVYTFPLSYQIGS